MVVLIFAVGIFIVFLIAISLRSMNGKENTFDLMKEEKKQAFSDESQSKEDPNVQEMFDLLNKKDKS